MHDGENKALTFRFHAEWLSIVSQYYILWSILSYIDSLNTCPIIINLSSTASPNLPPMSSITSTCTSSVLGSQRTQSRFQAGLKPFNKRSAKSDHAHATPAKVRKLSQLETAPQRLSVDTRAKVLVSSLKRRHGNRFADSKSLPPVSTVKQLKPDALNHRSSAGNHDTGKEVTGKSAVSWDRIDPGRSCLPKRKHTR